MSDPGPTRQQDSLKDVVEMLLDKGVVVNADIAVSVGETELLGVKVRAALASFETAAEYGLEFPEGTDMRRVEAASGRSEVPEEDVMEVETGDPAGTGAAGEEDDEDDEDDRDPEIKAGCPPERGVAERVRVEDPNPDDPLGDEDEPEEKDAAPEDESANDIEADTSDAGGELSDADDRDEGEASEAVEGTTEGIDEEIERAAAELLAEYDRESEGGDRDDD